MDLSDNGARLIGEFEGFYATPYNDPVGHCTIGIGHLIHRGNCVQNDYDNWGSLTESEAWRLLRDDVAASYGPAVDRLIGVPLDQNQFDALVSFTYNVGSGALEGSTLRARLNSGDYGSVRGELMRWTKAGGREFEGLRRRRAAEADLFDTPDAAPAPATDRLQLAGRTALVFEGERG